MQYKKLVSTLTLAGVILAPASVLAEEATQLSTNANLLQISDATTDATRTDAAQEDEALQEKIKARLAEIAAEEEKAYIEKNGHYVERRSYGTAKETDPPRYVKQANKTWLKDYDAFENVDWLDLGLEYRARYEYRDNDFRRRDENLDQPLLLRTRAYVGVKKILDPLRFTVELQDSRRNNGDYTREFDTRDINYLHILQGYAELNFDKSIFGKDDYGNEHPFWVRYGRHAWEAIDRRLIARNEWRNTTNNFEGLRANLGDKKNDWQLEFFAVQPIQRFTRENDKVNESQHFYGLIGDYRGWSKYVTLEPYYLLLKQDGNEVKFNTDGLRLAGDQLRQAQVDREIHTGGLRAYGVIPNTLWDYDASYVKQWGNQDRFLSNALGYINVDHDAKAYNAEIGYSPKHPWKPRFSAFYGVATGDKNPPTGTDRTDNERFDRLFGFARPWSNDDYIQMENIRTPKVRVEFEPKVPFLDRVQVDTGFSWYRLDSASDRWNAGGDLRDRTGRSGRDLGKEYDLRVRFALNQYAALNLGYAHFWAGDFVQDAASANAANRRDFTQNRKDTSNFFYSELTLLGF
jgi:hypothetical protein